MPVTIVSAALSAGLLVTVWYAPDVTIEQMYHGRPIRDRSPTLPSEAEQIAVLSETRRRYAEVYASHGVSAIAFPTIALVAPTIRADGPLEPLGEMLTLNGMPIEEGKVIARNIFIAPRIGAPALNVPVGLSNGLPVGLELDARPGYDSELLGLGIAMEKILGEIPAPPVLRRKVP